MKSETRISRKAIVWLAIPIALGLSLIVAQWAVRRNHERARVQWKAATLPHLAGLSIGNEDISGELETLKSGINEDRREWVSDHVLLMTNGDYLIYAFRHGFNNGFVNHLFLAHGSNRRWLYSTYHFCNQMAGARFDEPPGSIAEFAKRYSAREFDGESDECLKRTWPLNE